VKKEVAPLKETCVSRAEDVHVRCHDHIDVEVDVSLSTLTLLSHLSMSQKYTTKYLQSKVH
jgi:hypothetical protein